MSENVYHMTRPGFDVLEAKLVEHRMKRGSIATEIAEAREKGDLSENAEYQAAKEKQRILERKIAELEHSIANAIIIDVPEDSDIVVFGTTVGLVDMNSGRSVKYRIVGIHEADISGGLISIRAPLARELIGKRVGDIVVVETPGGIKEYKIVSIDCSVN